MVAEVNVETGERVDFVETMKAYHEAKDAFEASHPVDVGGGGGGVSGGADVAGSHDDKVGQKVERGHAERGSRNGKKKAKRRPTMMKLLQPAAWGVHGGGSGDVSDDIGYGRARRASMYFDGKFGQDLLRGGIFWTRGPSSHPNERLTGTIPKPPTTHADDHIEKIFTIFNVLDKDMDGRLNDYEAVTALVSLGITPSRRVLNMMHHRLTLMDKHLGIDFKTFVSVVRSILKEQPVRIRDINQLGHFLQEQGGKAGTAEPSPPRSKPRSRGKKKGKVGKETSPSSRPRDEKEHIKVSKKELWRVLCQLPTAGHSELTAREAHIVFSSLGFNAPSAASPGTRPMLRKTLRGEGRGQSGAAGESPSPRQQMSQAEVDIWAVVDELSGGYVKFE